MTTAIQFANDKPTPATSSSAQGCTMSRAARPTTCPKKYVAGVSVTSPARCGAAPTGHGVAPLASHTPAAQGLRKRVGMGKHRRFKSWNHPNSKLSWLCSQTISDEMHDVPLCSLVHKGRHGVEARKQVGNWHSVANGRRACVLQVLHMRNLVFVDESLVHKARGARH